MKMSTCMTCLETITIQISIIITYSHTNIKSTVRDWARNWLCKGHTQSRLAEIQQWLNIKENLCIVRKGLTAISENYTCWQ